MASLVDSAAGFGESWRSSGRMSALHAIAAADGDVLTQAQLPRQRPGNRNDPRQVRCMELKSGASCRPKERAAPPAAHIFRPCERRMARACRISSVPEAFAE